jgi:hypothetical protein
MHWNRRGGGRVSRPIRQGFVIGALMLGASTAFAQARSLQDAASAPVDELKRIYLACDWAASRTVLDASTAAHCSIVGEALQQRAFGGDFEQLLAWWRAKKDGVAAQVVQQGAPTARLGK